MAYLDINQLEKSVKKVPDLIDVEIDNFTSEFMIDNFKTVNTLKQTKLRKEFNLLCKNKAETKNLDTSLNLNDKKIYICKENQIRDIPPILNSIFPNYKKLYLMGVSIKNSFFHSILSIMDNQFILKGPLQKSRSIDDLRNNTVLELDSIFKKFNYKNKKYKKTTIRDNILSLQFLLPQTINFISDYYGICLIFIDTQTHLFSLANEYSKEKNFIVILKKNNYYQPILGTDGNNFFDFNILDNMEKILKPENEIDKSDKKKKELVNDFQIPDKLGKEKEYKLTELQQIAKIKNISIFSQGNKKKLKKDLYLEILNKYQKK